MTAAEFISKLGDQAKPIRTTNGWDCRCPAHEDGKASLSVKDDADKVIIHCHAGCSPESICSAIGITLADLFNGEKPKQNGLNVVATYDYKDEQGRLLYQVCRLNPKGFRQRKPDGKGGWDWSIKGVRQVPFQLPEVLKAVADGRPVYIAEGEKDCLAIEQAGFTATCNSGGAGKWREEFSKHFKGASVVIIADKDEPGRKHAQDVAQKLSAVASSVTVVELPGDKVKDAHDYFASGGTAAELDEIIDSKKPTNQIGRFYTTEQLKSFDPSKDIGLIGNRWLCRGGKLLLPSTSGAGKSTLLMQMLMLFALGQPFCGIKPARPLSSVIIGDENDEGDLAEMYQGILQYLKKSNPIELDEEMLARNMKFWHCPAVSGDDFVSAVENELKQNPRDIACIDPLVSFAGCNLGKQDDAGKFLRGGLSRIADEIGVIWFVIHHVPKPSKEKGRVSISDLQYAGAGTYDLPGWARTVMVLVEAEPGLYRLVISKRSKRSGATHLDGTPTNTLWLKHAEDGIYWDQTDPPTTPERGSKGTKPNDVERVATSNLYSFCAACKPEGEGKNEIASRLEAWLASNKDDLGLSTCKRIIQRLVTNGKLSKGSDSRYRKGPNA